MRTRLLVLAALVSVPAALSAQAGVGLPRGTRGVGQPPRQGTPLPPEIPVVSKALANHRSRWSAEGYTLITSITTVDPNGGSTRSNAFGGGTRADYRFTDFFSATADFTAAMLGGSTTTETAEVGTRFRPTPHATDIRPYLDVRAVYTNIHDSFYLPTNNNTVPLGPNLDYSDVSRYARGVGAMAGAGFDYTLTPSLALSTEFTAGRHKMDAYRLTGLAPIPGKNAYWMNVYRYTIGLRYNPTSSMHLSQNPMK
jgi:hypothetical protein